MNPFGTPFMRFARRAAGGVSARVGRGPSRGRCDTGQIEPSIFDAAPVEIAPTDTPEGRGATQRRPMPVTITRKSPIRRPARSPTCGTN